jgi:hypothetical protein
MKSILRFLCLLVPGILFAATNDVRINQQTSAGSYPNIYIAASGPITNTATFRSTLAIPGLADDNTFSGNNTFTQAIIINDGTGKAGAAGLKAGTTQSTTANYITVQAPEAVTAYLRTLPGAVGSTGYVKETVSGSTQTESVVATIPAADIAVGALANGMSATTQSAGDNSTKLATTAYADAAAAAAAKSASIGTYASPDTTGGAVTLTNSVTPVWTNTTTTYVLPAVASSAGKAVIFYVVGTNLITIDPNASEIIVRDGTPQTGGVTMTLAGVAGNYVCMVCEGGRWITLGAKGTLAAGS